MKISLLWYWTLLDFITDKHFWLPRTVCICSLSTFPCIYIFMHSFYHFLKIILYISIYFLSCIKITAPHEKHSLLQSLASLVSMPEPCWILASRLEGNLNGEKKAFRCNSLHFNFNCFCSHMQLCILAFTFTTLLFFIRSLNVFFVNQKKCFLKNDFDSQAKALEALKLQKKFEGLILSGQYRTLFGAWMWN